LLLDLCSTTPYSIHFTIAMNVLPLVAHELRGGAQRPTTRRIRLGFAAAAICVACWGLFVWGQSQGAATPGRLLLDIFGWSGFIGGVLAGLVLTSDCISQERREGTLELLFLTDLRGYDVAFGKFAARGILPFYCLLGIFPALAISVVVGGVAAGEVWRLWLVLINTLFFSLSVAILTSTLCQQQRAAQAGALFAILISVPGVPLLGAALTAWTRDSLWQSLGFLFSPAGNFGLAPDTRYQTASGWFWGSLLTTHLMAWMSLFSAGALLPWMASAKSSASSRREGVRWKFLRHGPGARRQNVQKELLSQNPIAWLASRGHWKQHFAWCLPALALWVWLDFRPDPVGTRPGQMSFIVLAAIQGMFKIWLGAEASHAFALGRRNGTLEMLLSTPLQTRDVAVGIMSALRRQFLGPLLAFFVLDLAMISRFMIEHNRTGAFLAGAGAAILLFDAYSLCWVGLWRGLVARDSAWAILSTLGRILVLPWIWFAIGASIFSQGTVAALGGIWLVLGVINNLAFLVNARDFFEEHFRTMALRPFGEKPPRIESKWSAMNWEEEPDGRSSAP
jgi:hypothetical protein